MSIVSINTLTPGLVGVNPRTLQLLTTDNLATITAAGYLNKQGQVLQGFAFYPTDIINVCYNYVAATGANDFGIFRPVIAANGTITLDAWENPGNVLLPVVDGHFATFNGTSGQIEDAGYLPSDDSLTNVVMQDSASVIGNIPRYKDVEGTIEDGGYVASDATLTNVVMQDSASVIGNIPRYKDVNGTLEDGGYLASDDTLTNVVMQDSASVIANLPQYVDVNGTIEDSGVAVADVQLNTNIIAARTADIGGGGAGPISVAVAGLTANSIVTGSIQASTNAVEIQKMTATATGFDVLFSADPGAACTVNYVAFIAAQ